MPGKRKESTQLAIVGAGPGGYTAAFVAADLGMDVTLIDPEERPGGVCLFHGCIPTKSLLDVAKVLREAKEAKNRGVEFGDPRVDIDRIRSWKESVVDKLAGGLQQLVRARKIRYVRAKARFSDETTLDISPHDGDEFQMSFDHAILATGSVPRNIPGLAIDGDRVITSTEAVRLPDVPETMLVIGSGYIGLEMGTIYSSLGSRVTLVEILPGLLPGADRDLVDVLHKELEKRFDSILLSTKVNEMKEENGRIRVRLEGKDMENPDRSFDKVLVAVGRAPNSSGLGLENTKVEVTDRGFVTVDAQRRTAETTIYAIGDLTGEPMLAHKAFAEGRVAAEAIAGRKVAFEPKAIPAVVFTNPEVVWCGLTETEATERGKPVKVTRVPWRRSSRALTMGRTDGLSKLVCDPETGRVLGMGAVGVGVGELVAGSILAIEMGAVAEDVELSIHPHPTLSETIQEAAELFSGRSIHVYRPLRPDRTT